MICELQLPLIYYETPKFLPSVIQWKNSSRQIKINYDGILNKSGEKAMNSTEYLLEFDEKNTQAMFQIVNSYVRTYLHNQILNKTVEKIRFNSI